MTEIKLQLDDPAEFARYARAHASQIPGAWRGRADQYLSIAEQIEEQVKPAIEEPTEFGSIVRAGRCIDPKGVEADLWQRSPWNGSHYWRSQSGVVDVWSQLRDPEVLRVGIGKAAPSLAERVYLDPMDDAPENEVDRSDVAPEQTEDYRDGFSEAKLAMRQQLRNLRAEALTAERQNAYDRAIAVVKEIQP